jgi:hypothetical protein
MSRRLQGQYSKTGPASDPPAHPDSPMESADHLALQKPVSEKKVRKYAPKPQKNYSMYQNIFELIRVEIPTVKVEGTSVYSIKGLSFSLSAQVLYDVDGMIVSDISYVAPVEVEKIEYIDDSCNGIRHAGANGIIKITI